METTTKLKGSKPLLPGLWILDHRELYVYLSGQLISSLGTGMQTTALFWLIQNLTGSPVWGGWVNLSMLLPTAFLAPIMSVVGDRWNTRRILYATQVASLGQAFLLAFLVHTNRADMPTLLVCSALLGIIYSVDIPLRNGIINFTVDEPKWPAAGTLMPMVITLGSATGLLLGGIVIAKLGMAAAFALNGLSYLAVIGALAGIKLQPKSQTESLTRMFGSGFRYCRQNNMPSLLLQSAVINIFGFGFVAVLQDLVQKDYRGDVITYGAISFASVFGSIVGGVFTLPFLEEKNLSRIFWAGTAMAGVCLLPFAGLPKLPVVWTLLFLSGFGYMAAFLANRRAIQQQAGRQTVSRVMGFYTLVFMGGRGVGGLLIGLLATAIGTAESIAVSGLLLLISLLAIKNKA